MECLKTKFNSYQEAYKTLKKLKKINDRRNARKEKRVYFCDKCGYYHLTSDPKSNHDKKDKTINKKERLRVKHEIKNIAIKELSDCAEIEFTI
jgi:hypothetical protein